MTNMTNKIKAVKKVKKPTIKKASFWGDYIKELENHFIKPDEAK